MNIEDEFSDFSLFGGFFLEDDPMIY